MVDINKYWVEGVLVEKYPNFVKELGADLDGNGQIEGKEAFGDLNHNQTVGDREDYKLYLEKNRARLSANVPFFKWGEKLSVGNRIHQLLYLESDLEELRLIQSAYHFVVELVDEVKKLHPSESDQKNVFRVHDVMKERMGIQFKEQEDTSFSKNVDHKELDCDTSSFATIAVGDELACPLSLVLAPQHVFVRWEKDGERFNIDVRATHSDDDYREKLKIDPQVISAGVYLKSLTQKELEGIFFFNRASTLERLGHHEEALTAYDKAVELNPKNFEAHNNRGIVLGDLGRYEEALTAYDKAIELNPKNAEVHYNQCMVLRKLGRNKEVLRAYKKAIALDPKLAIHGLEEILRSFIHGKEQI